jgi:hypothetical protein
MSFFLLIYNAIWKLLVKNDRQFFLFSLRCILILARFYFDGFEIKRPNTSTVDILCVRHQSFQAETNGNSIKYFATFVQLPLTHHNKGKERVLLIWLVERIFNPRIWRRRCSIDPRGDSMMQSLLFVHCLIC